MTRKPLYSRKPHHDPQWRGMNGRLPVNRVGAFCVVVSFEDIMAVHSAAFLRGTRLRSFLNTGRISAYIPPCAPEFPTGA
jgi:hypothetical protein